MFSDLGCMLDLHPQRAYLLRHRYHLGINAKVMTVERFLCDKMAILLHKKTCKYSFVTLPCQAEGNLFMFWELNCSHCGIELGKITIS